MPLLAIRLIEFHALALELLAERLEILYFEPDVIESAALGGSGGIRVRRPAHELRARHFADQVRAEFAGNRAEHHRIPIAHLLADGHWHVNMHVITFD